MTLWKGISGTLCVGYGLYAVANTMMLILFVFLRIIKVLCLRQECLRHVHAHLPVYHYSFHKYIMVLISFGKCSVLLISALRLGYFIKKLPYYILSVQPVVAEDKTGFFTRMGHSLKRK